MSDQKVMGEGMLKKYIIPEEGALQKIFDTQREFGSRFCPFKSLTDNYLESIKDGNKLKEAETERMRWEQIFLDCIADELSEVRGWLPWKHWKTYGDFVYNVTEIRYELIDILHFIVSEYLLIGLPVEAAFHHLGLSKTIAEGHPCDLDPAILRAKAAIMSECYIEPTKDTKTQKMLTIDLIRRLEKSIGRLRDVSTPYRISEYADILSILFRLFAVWDMSGKDVFNYYMSKNQENFERQARGY